jgi:hypothetical protein
MYLKETESRTDLIDENPLDPIENQMALGRFTFSTIGTTLPADIKNYHLL